MNTLLIASIFLILSLIVYYFATRTQKEGYEQMEQQYLDNQEQYYASRDSQEFKINQDTAEADRFYSLDDSQKEGEQLVMSADTSQTQVAPSAVDDNVAKCSAIKSCDELDGTTCGYCFANDRFYYGNEDGPYTDVCTGKWVNTKAGCQEHRERAICEKVKSCHEMVGDASICAWCPEKQKAFVYKEVNGKAVPKYPEKDSCTNLDINGVEIGLIKQSDCDSFADQHPCLGPNANNGPHSDKCLQKLWKNAGGSVLGTAAPQNNANQKSWWNQRGWSAVFDDMKTWVKYASGSDWNKAKTHYKGVYGSDPNPCDAKYGGPVECYTSLYTEYGCSDKGTGYPTNKPNMTTAQYIEYVKDLVNKSRDSTISYAERNDANQKCLGDSLPAPPALKVGDRVKYQVNVGGGLGAVCADTPETSNLVFEGYICKKSGTSCSVMWDSVTNTTPASRCGGSPRSWKKTTNSSMKWLRTYLGLCNKEPTYYNGKVKASIDESELTLVQSCAGTASCADSNCNLQCIVYISKKGGDAYDIAKTEVQSILQKVRSKYPGANLSTKNDMQYLVNGKTPYCACGWFMEGGSITSGYPTVQGTSSGCGGGQIKVVSCGSNGPSWRGNKAGMYVTLYANPENVNSILESKNLTATVIMVVGKNDYNSLLGSTLVDAVPPPPPQPVGLPPLDPTKYEMYGPYIGGGNGKIQIQEIKVEGDKYAYITKDGRYTKIVKAPPSGQNQRGYYYVGNVSEYGSKTLINQSSGKYKVRSK